ncbi:MAG TPA: TetR/AcrR family transcriptional regulator [Ilumatobacteraceae bacterium]|nr:TetR/AcrR family transcriptional regulator [Ilumatobacteraceae bacterium]
MARTPDPLRKRELLDSVVDYLAEQGLADTTLRPMAAALGVSINRLVHHFGSKEELITAALARAIDRQIEVQRKWLQRSPKLTQVELYRRWWKWICRSPRNLALVRLNYEAATLETTVTGLDGAVRADQIGVWRHDVEHRLVAEGLKPESAALEASLIKATFTGLVMDLFATGDTRRLTHALDEWLDRLDRDLRASRAD